MAFRLINFTITKFIHSFQALSSPVRVIFYAAEDTLTISIIKTCQFFSKTKSVKDEEFGNYAKESANKAILTFLI
ncbi:11903_t:CDS:2 [Entrophospora sp. SA101]|nr:11903_t:CDS:2 [Entrophospora sp. SA101]